MWIQYRHSSGVVAEVEAVVSLAEVPGVVVGIVAVLSAAVVRVVVAVVDVVVFGFFNSYTQRYDSLVWSWGVCS